MKAHLRIVLIHLVLFSASATLQAQNLIFFQSTDSKSYLVRRGSGGPGQEVTDFFIRTLSQGNGEPVDRTEFILVHDQFMRGTQTAPSEYQIYATLQGLRLTGDTRYRGFELADLMKPKAVKFTLERVNAQGRVMDSWDFASVPITAEPAVVANFRGSDSIGVFDNNIFRFRDLSFLYLPADKTPFAVRTTLIDEYYASIPELEALYNELKRIDPEDIEQLNSSETDLRRLRSQIETIRGGGYPEQLGLSAELDPAGYLPRFQEVDNYAAELGTRIRDNQANLYRLYYERGLAYLEKGDRPKATRDLQTAIDMQPAFAPAHLAMARLRYQEGDLAAASNGLLRIFRELNPGPEVRREGAALGGTIYQNYLGNADYALQQKRLENALVELDAAAAICTTIQEVACTKQMETMYGQAHNGIFASLALNAERSLNAGNPDQAINEAYVARQYALQHGPYVTDTALVGQVLNEAWRAQFQLMLSDVEILLKANDLDGAENAVAQAKAFRAAHLAALPDAGALIAAENKVADRRYKFLIAEGKSLASQSQWAEALGQYENALGMQEQFPLKRDSTLPQLALATAKALLQKEIGEAVELARGNRLREARDMRLAIDEVRKRYSLAGDAEIEPRYLEMKEAIFNQECANAQAEYNELVAKAERDISARDYLGARDAYAEALAVDSRNGACALEVKSAQSGKAHIAPATSYQELLKAVKKSVERALFREAVTDYIQAGNDFAEGDLGGRFGLSHVPLFEYIQRSGNREFIKYGAEHYADQRDYDSSISLLRGLVGSGYSKGRLKPVMVRIGQALAVRDLQSDPSANPKTKGLSYTGGDKGLKHIYKAYCKQWKQMK